MRLNLSAAILCISTMSFCTFDALARVTVAKLPTTSISKRDANPSKSGGGHSHLCSMGYPTYITVDEHGQTQVYVNDGTAANNPDVTKQEDYRVILPEGQTWQSTVIYAAGSEEGNFTCSSSSVVMDGGVVDKIFMGGYTATDVLTGDVSLTITGGTVGFIHLTGLHDQPIPGQATVSLSGMVYLGFSTPYLYTDIISGTKVYNRTTLFINSDCYFPEDEAMIHHIQNGTEDRDDVELVNNIKGAVFYARTYEPDMVGDEGSAYNTAYEDVFAVGDAVIPEGAFVDCHRFRFISREEVDPRDKELTIEHTNLTNYGTINLERPNHCSVWSVPEEIAFYNYGTIRETGHLRLSVTKLTSATCTADATYDCYCMACGAFDLPATHVDKALGHLTVPVKAIPATCYSNGSTAGTICLRCGEKTGCDVIYKTSDHTYGATISVAADSSRPCYPGSYTYQTCQTCGYVNINGTLSAMHVLLKNSTTVKSPTCTEYGSSYIKCSYCNYRKVTAIAPTHTYSTAYRGTTANCETQGSKAVYTCTSCNQFFVTPDYDSSARVVIPAASSKYRVIPALGHVHYTGAYSLDPEYDPVAETEKQLDDRLVSPATCEHGAVYYQTCNRCGKADHNYTFTLQNSTGHHYAFDHLDYVSNNVAQNGGLTIRCDKCDRLWSSLTFGINGCLGDYQNTTYPFHGYWYKTELTDILLPATCTTLGLGRYKLTFNFKGQTLDPIMFENFIPLNPDMHEWSDDGICHHTHYLYDTDNLGKACRDGYGNPMYYTNKNYEVIVDEETVFAASAYTAELKSDYVRNKLPIKAEDGSSVMRVFLDVTSYPSIDESLFSSVAELLTHNNPVTLGLLQDYTLQANDASNLSSPNLTIADLGHEFDIVMEDATAYTRRSVAKVPFLSYSRRFDQVQYHAMYLPFTMNFDDWCDYADVYKIVNVYEEDSNDDGRVDACMLSIRKLRDGDSTKANFPYIIRPKEIGTMNLLLHDVALQCDDEEPIACTSMDYIYTFCGTYWKYPVMPDCDYFISTTGALQYNGTSGPLYLSPQRWYMFIQDRDTKSPVFPSEYENIMGARMSIVCNDIDEATGIDQVDADFFVPISELQIFDLQGHRLAAPRQGLNIINGKKVIM